MSLVVVVVEVGCYSVEAVLVVFGRVEVLVGVSRWWWSRWW